MSEACSGGRAIPHESGGVASHGAADWLCLAAAPAAVLGLLSHSLTAMNVGLGSRELAGVELTGVLAASMTLLAIAARWLIVREHATAVSASAARRIRRRLVAAFINHKRRFVQCKLFYVKPACRCSEGKGRTGRHPTTKADPPAPLIRASMSSISRSGA